MFELTKNPTKYYIKIFFKVSEIEDSCAKTIFFGHECTRDFIARIVRLRSGRVDTNDIYNLKDAKMRIKVIAICNRQVTTNTAKQIRKKIIESLRSKIQDITTEDFVKKIISDALQKEIKSELNKIYPIRNFEFRKTQVL